MQRIPFPYPPNSCLSRPDSGLAPGAMAPTVCQLIPGRRSRPDPKQPCFHFYPALKPLFGKREPHYSVLTDSACPTFWGGADSSMKLREAEKRDIVSPTCLFPNIAYFPVPHSLLFLLWCRSPSTKMWTWEVVLAASFGRPRHLFGFLRSDVLMLSANVGGQQRRIAA